MDLGQDKGQRAQDSVAKLDALLEGTSEIVPEDEETARLVQMLQAAGPMIAAGNLIPDDAETLDEMLLGLASWALRLRSDLSPGYQVFPYFVMTKTGKERYVTAQVPRDGRGAVVRGSEERA